MKLSILICTVSGRERLLERLMAILSPQLNENVQVLLEKDNRELPIGAKRNRLLNAAQGEYVAFIDDDDRVSGDYCARILEAVESSPDCVGIEGTITFNGRGAKKFIHSRQYSAWFEENHIYYRCPNHLSPIKREHALKVMFPEINMGEDQQYSKEVLQYLQTEVYLEGPIYFYDFVSNKR